MIGARIGEELLNSKPGAVIYLDREEWSYMMDQANRDPLLVEREKTHGSFRTNADLFNKLCSACPDTLKGPQRMAMVMIFAKISRAFQTPHVKDHWDDIAGYAKLGAEACE